MTDTHRSTPSTHAASDNPLDKAASAPYPVEKKEPKGDRKEEILDALMAALDKIATGPKEMRQVKLKYARAALENAVNAFR